MDGVAEMDAERLVSGADVRHRIANPVGDGLARPLDLPAIVEPTRLLRLRNPRQQLRDVEGASRMSE
jgi:hypothetical protein